MTQTLAQIRNTVRERGPYVRSAKFTDAYVNREIQAAFGEFYELVEDVNEGWWDTQGNVSTVANQAYVAAPTGSWRIKGVDLVEGTSFNELDQVAIGQRNRWGSTVGKPEAYRLTARGIDLFPTPSQVYTLRVTYAPIAPTLEENTARDYVNGWDEYVIEATLYRLDKREERPLQDRLVEMERQRQRVIAGASRRRQQEPEYLNLREYAGSYEDPF